MANTNNFEGHSSRGDFYEALEDAIAAAKAGLSSELVDWTLSELSGSYGGFVGAKDLTVSIEATAGRGGEKSSDNGEADQSGEIQVPVFLSGLVSKLTGVDFCMDGATHLLETLIGKARLKAANDEARAVLDHLSGKKTRVAIAGYPVWGPECVYISVYYAAPTQEVVEQLAIKF